jgi:hypothetical protein
MARSGDHTGRDCNHRSGVPRCPRPIATVEIGIEVKALAKAMIKQIDRVISDFVTKSFSSNAAAAIRFALPSSELTTRRAQWATKESAGFLQQESRASCIPARKRPKPSAGSSPRPHRISMSFLVLRFTATNKPPFPFDWLDYNDTRLDYAAALSRISARYQQRF